MIKNKKFFSYGLYKEGVRQSRTLGLIGMVIILVSTLFTWLEGIPVSYDGSLGVGEVYLYGFEAVATLIMQYCLFTPFMVLGLFQFLNKRDASDAYHAMPHSRECLHISYFAGTMTWNVITTLSTIVLAVVLYGVTPYMALNISDVVAFGFNMFAAQLLVAASVLLAMSITGTRFTNLVVSLLIIFLPRLVLTAFVSMVNTAGVIVDVSKQFSVFNPSLNVAVGIPFNIFSLFDDDSPLMNSLMSPVCGIYTLVLGLLVFGAALWLLHHRKSESAGKSSPNRLLQGVYRVAYGFMWGLIPVAVTLSAIIEEDIEKFDFVVLIAVLVFFVALCYFLFELFTTKKAKNMVKAIPTFFLVLALNGIFLGAVLGIGNSLLYYTPTANEIESVSLVKENDRNYYANRAQETAIADPACKELISIALTETVDRVEKGALRYTYGENYHEIDVCINGERGKQYRRVQIESDHYDYLVNYMESMEEYKNSFYDIPAPGTYSMSCVVEGTYLTEAQNLGIYNALVEDVKAMPFEQWYPMAMGIDSVDTGHVNRAFTLQATLVEKGKEYSFYYPITKTLTPKAFDLTMQYVSQRPENNLDAFRAKLETYADTKASYDFDVAVTVLNPIDEYFTTESDNVTAVREVLRSAKPYTAGTDDVVLEVYLIDYTDYSQYDPSKDLPVYFTVERENINHYLETMYQYAD